MKAFLFPIILFSVFYSSRCRHDVLNNEPDSPYIDAPNVKPLSDPSSIKPLSDLPNIRPLLDPSNWLLYPLRWPQIKYVFPYKVQSPINILTSKARLMELSPLEIHFPWSSSEEMVSIENTGYYLEVLLPHKVRERPYLTGGPLLDSKYVFEQLHFHWGPTDQCGSEHHIDGRCFPTEVHVVYYNKAYGSFEESVNHPDGVAVLAIFGNISPEHNHDFDNLIREFTKIVNPESKTNGSFNKEFKFLDILFQQPTYYSFPGSLTTPSYSECVTWIVVPVPFNIAPEQLDVFRMLKAKDGHNLRDNDRQLQDFAGRPLVTPSNHEKFCFTQEITYNSYS